MPDDIEETIRQALHAKGAGISADQLARNTFPARSGPDRSSGRRRFSIAIAATAVAAVCLTVFTLTATRDHTERDAPAGPPVTSAVTSEASGDGRVWSVDDISGVDWVLSAVTKNGATTAVPELYDTGLVIYQSTTGSGGVDGDDSISFSDACNGISGSLVPTIGGFTLSEVLATRKGCYSPEPLATATELIHLVLQPDQQISIANVADNSMTLAVGSNSLTYIRAGSDSSTVLQTTTAPPITEVQTSLPAVPRPGTVDDIVDIDWVLYSVTEDGTTTDISPADGSHLSMMKTNMIRGSTTISFGDGCNGTSGQIAETTNGFVLLDGSSTAKACSITTMGRVVNAVLQMKRAVAIYDVTGNSMTLAVGSNSLTYHRDTPADSTDSSSSTDTSAAEISTIPLPTSDFDLDSTVGQSAMAGLFGGELILDDVGCVALKSGSATEDARTVAWPTGFTARVVDGNFEIHDQDGIVVAHQGDRISVSGGSSTAGTWGVMLGQACLGDTGAVLIVQGEVTVVSPAPTTTG